MARILDESYTAYHTPVLVKELVAYLQPQPGKTYMDLTFGGGGHTRAILEKEKQCSVIGLDWDTAALENGQPMVEEFQGRLRLLWGNFAQLYALLKREKIGPVDGIIADVGTSHHQIMERAGFSLYKDSPLDMRMSPAHHKVTAAEVLNKSSEEKLSALFWQLSQERYAKKIARAIVHDRASKPFTTTRQLAQLIERIVPTAPHHIHPATRVFQALRIYVNDELNNIHAMLPAAFNALNVGGRLIIISFHSEEDRLVKQFFGDKEREGVATLETPSPVMATEQEIADNLAARSAKMRVLQRSL